MEIVLFLWLAGIVDDIKEGLVLIVALIAFLLAMAVPILSIDNIQTYKQKWWRITLGISIATIIFAGILPSKNTMYLMAGGYYGQKALQSETAGKVMTIINQHLDEKIKELTK